MLPPLGSPGQADRDLYRRLPAPELIVEGKLSTASDFTPQAKLGAPYGSGRSSPSLPASGNRLFIHIRDAARATVAAISRGDRSIYNIVDDEPAPVLDWLPELAWAVGTKPSFRVPIWLGRLLIGEGGVSYG